MQSPLNNPKIESRQELDLAILRMRAGDLFEMTREERASKIASLCPPRDVERLLNSSYRSVGKLSKVNSQVLGQFQGGVRNDGREIGRELVSAGLPEVIWIPNHFSPEAPKGMFAKATLGEVDDQIRSYVEKRIGARSGYSLGTWHFVNAIIFIGWIGSVSAEASGISDWLQMAWALSVLAMIFPYWRMHVSSDSLASKKGHAKQWMLIEEPLRDGIETVLLQAMGAREHEAPDWENLRGERRKSGQRRRNQASTSKRAEEMCAAWLRSRGQNARTTEDGPDGGVDIRSYQYLGQVKNYKGSVAVQAVREIYGLAAAEGKEAIFFTSGRYTKAAVDFADKVGMPLITYDAVLHTFTGANWSGKLFV